MSQKFSTITLTFLLIVSISLSACSNSQSISTSPISVSPTPTPFPPAPHFNVTIPQKALLKNYVTVSAKAEEGTICRLTFIPASGEMLVMDTVANAGGECTWKWKLEESYGKGDGRLIFTINGVSDTHFIQIFKEF